MKYSEADQDNRRIVAVDPGLLTPEELLARNKDRKTLRELVRQQSKAPNNRLNLSSILVTLEEHVRKFLDTAQIRISVS